MTDGWVQVMRPSGQVIQVREWRVGDPLACSNGRKGQYSIPCEPPAVVVQIVRDRWAPMTYQVCPHHFVLLFWPGGVESPTTEVHRRARALLLDNHRDEYRQLYEDCLAELMAECVAAVPEGVHQRLGPQVARHVDHLKGSLHG